MPARRQPPTVRLRRLASELRSLRTAAGLTRDEVCVATGINAATLYRIETAKVRPQRRTLIALLDQYGVNDPDQRTRLVELSKQSHQLGWLQSYEAELPEDYTTYISFEAESQSIRNYESSFVPGLLQTQVYARAAIRGVLPLIKDPEVEHRVQARLRRQEALTRDDPLKLSAIIDEAALRRRVGGPSVMAAQLHHLVDQTDAPHITVQVIPYSVGAHPGMHGAFAVLDFPDPADPELVYVENTAGALFLEREAEIRRYTDIFHQLAALALSPTDSVRFITDLALTIEQEAVTS